MEQKLEFYHEMNPTIGKYTLVIDVGNLEHQIHNEKLLDNLSHSRFLQPVKLVYGVAHCHPKDQYVKKIGRETSLKKLKEENFYIHGIEVDHEHGFTSIGLFNANKTVGVQLKFKRFISIADVMVSPF